MKSYYFVKFLGSIEIPKIKNVFTKAKLYDKFLGGSRRKYPL